MSLPSALRNIRPQLALLGLTMACSSSLSSTPAAKPEPPHGRDATDAAPAVPENFDSWGRETIALPPSFALQMALSGQEELLFAPGMFKSDAEDYFSYAFVLRYPEDAHISNDQLSGLLEQYYRGLMVAVASAKDADSSAAEAVTVSLVDTRDEVLHLSVATYDAFVRLAPLELHMRVTQHPMDAGSCLRFQVSPQGDDHPLWNRLSAAAVSLSCDVSP